MGSPKLRPFFGAAADFATGKDTPREYLERCLAVIEEREPEILAFTHLDPPAARAQADRASARWRQGKPLSPIDGMPVGVKDIIETFDMPTQMGSDIYQGWRSGRDGATVAALREAGAVILGKTVTTEFATSPPGPTRNPWDTRRTPGGSSSGSAAAVGAGMIPFALGTQVIGSILRPASYCGCIGFKPSLGAINRGGSHDALSQSVHGALAASLADAWMALREISSRAGGDPGFPGLYGPASPPAPKKPRRLAVLESAGWPVALPAAKAALAAALEKLSAAGVEILRRDLHPGLAAVETALLRAMPLSRAINNWETRWPLNTYHAQHAEKLSRFAVERLAEAEAMSLEDYRAALAERARIRVLHAGLAAECDAMVTISAPGPAPLGLQSTGDPSFVVQGSLLAVPAVSLPLLQVEGMPLGLQLLGFMDQDAALIATASWVSDALAPER
jgi:Asp-tRNA(Asn)/Glu-tRNA(Gln) amidotransferase A subunit family amidase